MSQIKIVQDLEQATDEAIEVLSANQGRRLPPAEATRFSRALKKFHEIFSSSEFKTYIERMGKVALMLPRKTGMPTQEAYLIVKTGLNIMRYGGRLSLAHRIGRYDPHSLTKALALLKTDFDLMGMHEVTIDEAFAGSQR